MNKKIIASSILTVALLTLTAPKVAANYMYGAPEPSRQIIVDKQLKPDRWESWKDNLSAEQYVFVANDKIDFKIVVKNTGGDELKNITVIDYLPDYVNFLSASEGYSLEDKEVKWGIGQLDAGNEKEYQIQAQIVGSEQLAGKGSFCVINRAKATAETGESDENAAEFCIESRVLGAEELPEAGADLVLGAAAGLALTSLGFLFKKKK